MNTHQNSIQLFAYLSMVVAACATAAVIATSHDTNAYETQKCTLPTSISFTTTPTLILTKAARHTQERYSM